MSSHLKGVSISNSTFDKILVYELLPKMLLTNHMAGFQEVQYLQNELCE